MIQWKKFEDEGPEERRKVLPRHSTFLLFDPDCKTGAWVYEAMLYDDGTVGCPALTEDYDLREFSHWAVVTLPEIKEEKCERKTDFDAEGMPFGYELDAEFDNIYAILREMKK